MKSKFVSWSIVFKPLSIRHDRSLMLKTRKEHPLKYFYITYRRHFLEFL